jgi:quercetin dioxygenase-like cupin family protein
MPGIESKSFDQPDETKAMDKTTIELVGLASGQIQRTTFEPGWKWSERIGPIVGTDRCQVEHIGYAVAGRLQIEHDDGSTAEIKAGDVFRVAPGHDGRVVGDEPVIWIEFQAAAHLT